jgi:hypothetical protein
MLPMKNIYFLLSLLFSITLVSNHSFSQEEEEEEEDFSAYDSFDMDENTKRYCTPKIVGISPAKLITIGYDFAGPHTINAGAMGDLIPSQSEEVSNYHGLRLGLNLPLVSNNKILINLGMTYLKANYNFTNSSLAHPLHRALNGNIRSLGVNTTIFKPLNEKNFLLGFYAAEYSGNYDFIYFQSMEFVKHSAVIVYGWKPHDRLQYGFGATQSYRAGEVNLFPIIMYNFTSKNRNWGIEALLPARMHYRYKLDQRSLLFAGFELEGTSYHLSNRPYVDFPENLTFTNPPGESPYDAGNLELRRSEIRLHAKYEYGITSFIWLSAQVGYALNYRFDVDNGEFFRGFFKDVPYVMENQVSGTPYIQLSLNLVSP